MLAFGPLLLTIIQSQLRFLFPLHFDELKSYKLLLIILVFWRSNGQSFLLLLLHPYSIFWCPLARSLGRCSKLHERRPGKGKGLDTCYSATYMSGLVTSSTLQSRKWQLICMSQWCRSTLCGNPLPALTDNWTHGAASRHRHPNQPH